MFLNYIYYNCLLLFFFFSFHEVQKLVRPPAVIIAGSLSLCVGRLVANWGWLKVTKWRNVQKAMVVVTMTLGP